MQDTIAWQTENPIKVVSFTYTTRLDWINSIQVTISNGQSSPIFAGPKQDSISESKKLLIGDASQIKRIQGTIKNKSLR